MADDDDAAVTDLLPAFRYLIDERRAGGLCDDRPRGAERGVAAATAIIVATETSGGGRGSSRKTPCAVRDRACGISR